MSLMTFKEIRITPNKREDLKALVVQIQPSWPSNDIVITELKGGYSHRMYLCHLNNENKTHSIAVRVRNVFESTPLCNHDFEVKVLENLYARNLFPKLYATFQNGYVYEYVEGDPVFSKNFTTMTISDRTLRLIATKLSLIHSITITEANYLNDSWFSRIKKFVETSFPEKPTDKGLEHFTKSKVLKEIDSMEDIAVTFDTPLVLCHGDCHSANMIKKNDDVIFVDFEWTHLGYQAEDIAFFLQVLEINELTFDLNISVPLNHERKFLKYYLESWYKRKEPKCKVNDYSVDRLQEQVKLFKLLSTLFVLLAHISLPDLSKSITDDRVEFLQNMLRLYSYSRKGILGKSSSYF